MFWRPALGQSIVGRPSGQFDLFFFHSSKRVVAPVGRELNCFFLLADHLGHLSLRGRPWGGCRPAVGLLLGLPHVCLGRRGRSFLVRLDGPPDQTRADKCRPRRPRRRRLLPLWRPVINWISFLSYSDRHSIYLYLSGCSASMLLLSVGLAACPFTARRPPTATRGRPESNPIQLDPILECNYIELNWINLRPTKENICSSFCS